MNTLFQQLRDVIQYRASCLGLTLCCLLSFSSFIASAQGVESIGQTVIAIGDVKAVASHQAERTLKRGDPLYLLDKILVGAASKTQLRFNDGGIINLIASTEYQVDSYVFNHPNQKSEFVSSLIKGGFRAISGAIAKENVSGTVIKTPIATIGLRGTICEAVMADINLAVGCEEGKTIVSNAKGTVEIGPSSPTLYATVVEGQAPVPSKEKPTLLANVSFDVEQAATPRAEHVTAPRAEQFTTPRAEQVMTPQEMTLDYSGINMGEIPYEPMEGYAYEESYRSSILAPTIVFGAISIVAIIALTTDRSHHHSSESRRIPAPSYSSCSCCSCCCH